MRDGQTTPRDIEQLLAEADWLRRLARGLVRDTHLADDLVQDTWLAAMRRAPQASAADLRAWMTAVVRNFSRRQHRDANLRALHEPLGAREEAVQDPESIAARVELQRELAVALLALDEPYRTAIVLRYLEGLTAVQVARELGISPDNARQRISRGLAMLRSQLDRDHGSRSAWLVALQPFAVGGASILRNPPLSPGWLIMGMPLKVATLLVVCVALALVYWSPRSDGPASKPSLADARLDRERTVDAGSRAPAAGTALDERTAVASERIAAQDPGERAGESSLTGEVRDERGAPVAGAAVRAIVFGDSGFRHLEASLGEQRSVLDATRTDERGRFELEIGRRGVVQLEVDAGGRGGCLLGEQRAGEHVIATVRPSSSIRGRVVNTREGEPIGGAIVLVALALPIKGEQDRATVRLRRSAASDERGEYRLDGLPPGRYEVAAAIAGGGPLHQRTIEISAGAALEFDFDVGNLVQVRGTVRDALTRMPIAGAEVATSSEFDHPTRSNARGEFELLASAEFLREIDARAPGYGVIDRDLRNSPASALAQVDLELLRARRCTGRVLAADGDPIAGAYVAIATNLPRDFLRVDWRATQTDAGGAFEVGDLRADMGLSLLVRKPGFGTLVQEFSSGDRSGKLVELGEIRLAPELEIAGTVRLASDAPLANTKLVLRGASSVRAGEDSSASESLGAYFADREARSDAGGRFSFAELAAGDYVLDAYLAGHNDAIRVAIRLEPGCSRTDVSVVVPVGRRLAGFVRDAAGVGVANASVSVEPETGDDCGLDLVTDADGRFEARDVPVGEYTLRAWPAAQAGDRVGAWLFLQSRVQHVPAGSVEVEIVLEESDRVRGHVFEHDGARAEAVYVDALDSHGEIVASDLYLGVVPFELGVRRGEVFTIVARPGLNTGATVSGYERDLVPSHAAHLPGVTAGGTEIAIQLPAR